MYVIVCGSFRTRKCTALQLSYSRLTNKFYYEIKLRNSSILYFVGIVNIGKQIFLSIKTMVFGVLPKRNINFVLNFHSSFFFFITAQIRNNSNGHQQVNG